MSDNKAQEKLTPLNYYLELGRSGQFPLFYKDWLEKVNLKQKQHKKRKNVQLLKKLFKKIERHKTTDKKRIAISAMSEEDRTEFLETFFYALEEEILSSEHKYH